MRPCDIECIILVREQLLFTKQTENGTQYHVIFCLLASNNVRLYQPDSASFQTNVKKTATMQNRWICFSSILRLRPNTFASDTKRTEEPHMHTVAQLNAV